MEHSGQTGKWLRAAALAAVALGVAVAAFATIAPAPQPLLLQFPVLERLPLRAAVLPGSASFRREAQFQRGDTLPEFLRRLGVAEAQLERLARERVLRLLRPGTVVNAETGAEGELRQLTFFYGRDTLFVLEATASGWRTSERRAPLETFVVARSSVIRTSLFAATDAAGIPDGVAVQLADVFGGDLDFHRDLRRGDRFSVVYEVLYLDGRPVRAGRVLAAEVLNQGRLYRAVYFAGADGKGGFYAPGGKNMRKAFLRSPLEYSRVSSGFGLRRHPILRTWRAHQGIDYVAPVGTRVRAVGDGVVDSVGRNGNYGNLVVIRHAGQYSTAYAHLGRFAADLRSGTRVAQGDIIGYVGQTGWATGPHLHYEFRVGREARNPFTLSLPSGLPVPAEELAAFRRHAEPLLGQLDLIADSNLALRE